MSAEITRKVEVTVTISGFDMGRAFASMHSEDQAQFFNGIAAEVKSWKKPGGFQWAYIREDLDALPDGLSCFRDMAEYAST